METTIVVDGREIHAAAGAELADAIAAAMRDKAPARDYLVVKDGEPEGMVRWDGETDYDPGAGAELVPADEWKGKRYTGPKVDPQQQRRERLVARAADSHAEVLLALAGLSDAATLAQLRVAVRVALRAQRRSLALLLDLSDEQDAGDGS